MNFLHLAQLKSCSRPLALAAISLFLAGCSANKSNTGAPAPAAQSTEAKATPKNAQPLGADAPAKKSVFSTDQNSRDPFFPKAKRAVAVTETAKQPEAVIDVTSVLQSLFQGVVGNGETYIALINNVMLEPGRQTLIPISAGGQSRTVSVRCREVLRDAVVLEVQGHAQPVRLVKAAYN